MILPGTSASEVSSFESSDGSSKLNFSSNGTSNAKARERGREYGEKGDQTVLPLFESLRDFHSDRDNCIKDVSS
jgi:hypothetical protein